MFYLGVGDAEADGDLDVWTRPVSGEGAQVWLNDGGGGFDRSLAINQLFSQGLHRTCVSLHAKLLYHHQCKRLHGRSGSTCSRAGATNQG